MLKERNKHILLAEKYGWDMVACYTADPLASDLDDEKKIRKAVKESKQLREEKKRAASSKVPKANELFHALRIGGLSSSTVMRVTRRH